MAGIDWTQVSIGVACVVVLGVVFIKVISAFVETKKKDEFSISESLLQVIENNTKAIESLSTVFQVNFARQEARIDECVAYVRNCKQ